MVMEWRNGVIAEWWNGEWRNGGMADGMAEWACWVRYTHSGNYEARGASGDYKARGASSDYKARGASGGKYEARMVILCILAAVN